MIIKAHRKYINSTAIKLLTDANAFILELRDIEQSIDSSTILKSYVLKSLSLIEELKELALIEFNRNNYNKCLIIIVHAEELLDITNKLLYKLSISLKYDLLNELD